MDEHSTDEYEYDNIAGVTEPERFATDATDGDSEVICILHGQYVK